MSKALYKITEEDGMLAIYETRLGQNVNPRLYSGLKRKFIELFVKWFFTRIDKKI